MQTLLAILKLFPALLENIQAIERALPLPQKGREKFELLLGVIRAAYDAEETIRKEIPWERLAGIVASVARLVVTAFNEFGIFKRSKAPSVEPAPV